MIMTIRFLYIIIFYLRLTPPHRYTVRANEMGVIKGKTPLNETGQGTFSRYRYRYDYTFDP